VSGAKRACHTCGKPKPFDSDGEPLLDEGLGAMCGCPDGESQRERTEYVVAYLTDPDRRIFRPRRDGGIRVGALRRAVRKVLS
jgi:hypothetical protein